MLTTEIYTLSLHDALPICGASAVITGLLFGQAPWIVILVATIWGISVRSEEHTSELQSRLHLVCRLLLEKKNKYYYLYKTSSVSIMILYNLWTKSVTMQSR